MKPQQTSVIITPPVTATYTPCQISHYRGNPLIEALPPIRNREYWKNWFTYLPQEPDALELNMLADIKMHALFRLKKIFVPFPRHLELQERLDIVLREAYVGKSIAGPERQQALQRLYEAMQKGEEIPVDIEPETSGESFSLVGCSGLGKTWAISRYKQHIPERIWHEKQKVLQIPILIVECPHSGSTWDLAVEILTAIDKLIGTTFAAESKRLTEDQILLAVAHKFELYCVGLLILDEIQNVSVKKSQGQENFVNFFLKLFNIVKCSVVVIGTMKAIKVLQTDFRQARRLSSLGTLFWERMPRDSKDWNRLVEALWRYQWATPQAVLTDEIRQVLYDHSQGITSLLVRLLILSQIRAVRLNKPLSAELLRQVAQDGFKMLQPFINALRSSDPRQIAKYEDLMIPQVEDMIEMSGSGSRQAFIDSEGADGMNRLVSDVRSRAIDSLHSLNMPLSVAIQTVEDILAHDPHMDAGAVVMEALGRISGKAKQKSRNKVKKAEESAQSNDSGQSGYQKFLDEGLIRPPGYQPGASDVAGMCPPE